MKRFVEFPARDTFHISIEYVISHERSESCILHKVLPFTGNSLEDDVNQILTDQDINRSDVISISSFWLKTFKNYEHDGKFYKVVEQD